MVVSLTATNGLAADRDVSLIDAQPSLLETFLKVDERLGISASPEDARAGVRRYARRLESCRSLPVDSLERTECVIDTFFASGVGVVSAQASSPIESTVSNVLVHGKGTCAALVAAALVVADEFESSLRAVVLRDHVVLASMQDPTRFYEAVEGGRRITEAELLARRRSMPTRMSAIGGRAYVPYYLDNIAARLAKAGDTAGAGKAFQLALEGDRDTPRVLYNYGTFLLESGRSKQALNHLDRAIRRGWRDADAYVNRGAAHWKLGNLRAARRDFKRALKIDPSNQAAERNLRKIRQVRREAD